MTIFQLRLIVACFIHLRYFYKNFILRFYLSFIVVSPYPPDTAARVQSTSNEWWLTTSQWQRILVT